MTCAVPDFPLSSIPASLSWPPVPPGSFMTPYMASVIFSMVGSEMANFSPPTVCRSLRRCGCLKTPLDALLGRHQAGFFGGKVNARLMADPQFIPVIGQAVDAELHARRIKEHVA